MNKGLVEFSIIIPHYNSAQFINRLLDSVPLCDDIEIIIVDDNSKSEDKDRLQEIIKEYNLNIKLMLLTQNGGAGKCRNKALKVANGKWLIFADADDYFTDGLTELLEVARTSTADVIYFNATSTKLPEFTQSQRHCRIDKWISNHDEVALRLSFHGPVCKIIRRDLIVRHQITFFESKAFNDALFSAKVGYFAENIKIIDTKGYCITESPQSTTYTVSADIIKARLDATFAFNQFLTQNHIQGHRMPIIPHLIYARRLGIVGFVQMQFYFLSLLFKH